MSPRLGKWLVVLLLSGSVHVAWAAAASVENLRVLGRSQVDGYQVALDEPDRQWLRDKGVLVLGASAPDYPPFGITGTGRDYEGLTADYAALLAELLQVRIEVRRYPSRADVVHAVKQGEVDLLGTSNDFEAADPQLIMSSAYAEDQPTLVTRIGDSQNATPDLAGKQVAMLYHYLPPEAVTKHFPNARLQLYPSTLSAIGAVAFGTADVYLGDSISANYLINKNYLNNVQLAAVLDTSVNDFAFSMPRGNPRLLRIVNAALAVIPASERVTIQRRWSAGGANMSGLHALQFSGAEQRWMEQHPHVKVAIDESFLPLSFYGQDGKFRGLGADVLAKVALRTGLKFDIQRLHTVPELIRQVESGQADLLISLTPSAEREQSLRFTRPYLSTPYVLVSRTSGTSPATLDEMVGKRLAVIRGTPVRDQLIEQYPRIELIDADNAEHAMTLVANGRADAAVSALITARYMISRQYRDRLRITSTVGTTSARLGFATARDANELYSILDKTLLSIPPEELDEVSNRWRSEVVVDDSYWLRHRAVIIQGFALAAVLLLLALGWIAYLRQLIAKRKQAEVALSDQLEFMRVLIDGTPHPIYVRDRQARLLICNSGYLDVFGIERDVVVGKTVIEGMFKNVQEAAVYHQDYLQVMQDGQPRVQDRQLTLGANVLTIYHWMLPYRASNGEVSGLIGGWIDISERQRLVQALHEAKDEADDANRAKTTFLATMSHEIRTPMNAVIGMLELAMKKADQGVTDRFAIEVASGAARSLLDLIGDILDVSRIESGHLSLTPERANLGELVTAVARVFEGLARQKQLRLILEMDLGVHCEVLIDPLRFKQIVSNLLSNAIKFTEAGEVHLRVRVQPGPDDHLSLRLQVADTGIGISNEDQQRLFSPFTQASNNRQSGRSGSGLGLVISRTLCEMMGGQLTLSSLEGQGTQVEVSLDLPTLQPLDAPVIAPPEPASAHRALSILVVDDYPANRLLLSQQLSYLGHRVRDAEDGVQGLRAWRSQAFDVVITDCNMPLMTGYELTRAIREEERTRGLVSGLILGFTANAQPEEKQRCRLAGMDDCLFKPISLEDLGARLASLIPSSAQADSIPTDDIDLSALQQLTRGDESSIKRLLDDLASSNDDDMAKLMRLFTQHDVPGLANLAHRIKGGARIIKAQALIAACEQLEAACDCVHPEQLTEAVDQLHQAMELLAQRLE
ncbi:transporter substrate-binding domain-containing protein [Pseudomonas sp. LB3P31]